MNTESQRLYKKYQISKWLPCSCREAMCPHASDDGMTLQDADPDAQYFVLRLDTDLAARVALEAYAIAIWNDNREFAYELRRWLSRLRRGDHIEALRMAEEEGIELSDIDRRLPNASA